MKERFKKYLEDKKRTVSCVARETGIGREMLSKYLRGSYKGSANLRFLLNKFLSQEGY